MRNQFYKEVLNDDYKLSNDIPQVRLNSFSGAYYKMFMECGTSYTNRNIVGQKVLDYLCDKFKIERVKLIVYNAPQLHHNNSNGSLRDKTLGRYFVGRNKIEIWNLTAKTKKDVSSKTFWDTLLHEFMHHYDYKVLKMGKSLHCVGFYKRISDLKEKMNK